MTTPSPDRGAVSVEPMTDYDMEADAICAVRERLTNGLGVVVAFIDDHAGLAVLLAQRAVLAGLASDADPETQERLAAAAEPHRSKHEKALGRLIVPTLPLPRRYTGGPLEDGVYLWRKPNWHRTQFVAMGVEEGVRAPHNAPRLLPDEWVWLIGPLSIPPIPESEEASS